MWTKLFRTRKNCRRNPGRKPFRPEFEALECRLVPATVTWNHDVAGDWNWNTAEYWTVQGTNPPENRVPGAGDDAQIIGSAGFTVTHSENIADSVKSLTSDKHLVLSGGSITVGSVASPPEVTTSSAPDFHLSNGATFHVLPNAVMTISDASDIAGTIQVDDSGTFVFAGPGNHYTNINDGASLIGSGQYKMGGGVNQRPLVQINTPLTLPPNFAVYAFTLNLNADVTAGANLVLDNGPLGEGIIGSGTLTVPRGITFDWQSGHIGGGLGVENPGTVEIQDGAFMNIHTDKVKVLSRRTINNNNGGTVTWADSGRFEIGDNGVFINQVRAQFNVQGDALMSSGSLTGRFENLGTFTKTGGGGTLETSIYTIFNNTGMVSVSSGTLALYNGGRSDGGTFDTGTFTEVHFRQALHSFNSYTLAAGTTLQGTGLYSEDAGGLVIVDVDSVANLALNSGGTLKGAGTLTVSRTFDWQGGGIGGDLGTVEIQDGAVMNIHTDNGKTLTRHTINNEGTVNWTGGGLIIGGTGAVIDNKLGGVFNALNSDPLPQYFVGNDYCAFNNEGTFVKTGTGTTGFTGYARLNNDGFLSLQSGTLSFAGPYVQNRGGVTNIATGATLAAGGAGVTLEEGSTLSGSGTVRAATVRNRGTITVGSPDMVGILTIDGNYVQEGTGTLVARLTHDAAGQPQSDQLQVTGRATLQGTLSLQALDSVFAADEAFRVLQAQSVVNTFDTITGLSLPDGHSLDPHYDANGLSLVVL